MVPSGENFLIDPAPLDTTGTQNPPTRIMPSGVQQRSAFYDVTLWIWTPLRSLADPFSSFCVTLALLGGYGELQIALQEEIAGSVEDTSFSQQVLFRPRQHRAQDITTREDAYHMNLRMDEKACPLLIHA